MINPFEDFKEYPYKKKEIPLDRIVRAKERVMGQIVEGYVKLVEEEVKELVWLVENSRVFKAYSSALRTIQQVDYDSDDIEELCLEIDKGGEDSIPDLRSCWHLSLCPLQQRQGGKNPSQTA